jgi:hypothetical protein
MTRLAERYLPILGWLPKYERKWLAADAVAGLSVWALLVPQSLATLRSSACRCNTGSIHAVFERVRDAGEAVRQPAPR